MSEPARILIVDDEPNVRLVFRTTLEAAGYRVATAVDGGDAVEHLEREGADLVLLDLQMPVMGGMETLQHLREADNGVAVVIVTAYGSVVNAVQAMKLGAIDFLAKPLRPESLRQVVAEVLLRHNPRNPGPDLGPPTAPPITARSQYLVNLTQAKLARNGRRFTEAEVFLKQAIGLDDASAEAHNLMGVLHELRHEHDASYRAYKAALRGDAAYEPAKYNMLRYYERVTFGTSAVPVDLGDAS